MDGDGYVTLEFTGVEGTISSTASWRRGPIPAGPGGCTAPGGWCGSCARRPTAV
ncbi:MAG: hypothetical protein ACLR5H_11925 [Oscillospiraceae bacterium]